MTSQNRIFGHVYVGGKASAATATLYDVSASGAETLIATYNAGKDGYYHFENLGAYIGHHLRLKCETPDPSKVTWVWDLDSYDGMPVEHDFTS